MREPCDATAWPIGPHRAYLPATGADRKTQVAETHDPGNVESPQNYRSNVFEVGFGASSFELLFGWQEQGGPMKPLARITLAPGQAKLLHFLLVDALAQFEQRFGFIEY